MKLLLSACAVVATFSLVFMAAFLAQERLAAKDPLVGLANYSSAIVETLAENDVTFRERFTKKLQAATR